MPSFASLLCARCVTGTLDHQNYPILKMEKKNWGSEKSRNLDLYNSKAIMLFSFRHIKIKTQDKDTKFNRRK